MESLPNEIQYYIIEYAADSICICTQVCSIWHAISWHIIKSHCGKQNIHNSSYRCLAYSQFYLFKGSYIKNISVSVHPSKMQQVVNWLIQNKICRYATRKSIRMAIKYKFSVNIMRKIFTMVRHPSWTLNTTTISKCTPTLIKILITKFRVKHYDAIIASMKADNLALFEYIWRLDPNVMHEGESVCLMAVESRAWKILSWWLRRGHSRSLRKMVSSVDVNRVPELIAVLKKHYPVGILNEIIDLKFAYIVDYSCAMLQHGCESLVSSGQPSGDTQHVAVPATSGARFQRLSEGPIEDTVIIDGQPRARTKYY